MPPRLLLAALLLLALAAPGAGSAQGLLVGERDEAAQDDESTPFDVSADSIELESGRQIYVAEGNVVIEQPGRTLRADWVAFSNRTRQGVATGNVVVEEGPDILYADVLHFEIDELRGIVLDGTLLAGREFRLEGDEIRKVGEQEYEIDEAAFTTCRCPEEDDRDPWRIRADEADLEFGGYATTRSSTFDVLGVPILWLPWMRYPLKTERETGFLFPEIGAGSRTGFDVGLPFFWAARKNINVILTPRWLTENGFKPDAEMEYVFGERSWGQIYASGVFDRAVGDEDELVGIDRERWALEWLHDQSLPDDWRFKVSARQFSDNRYTFDFDDFSRYHNDRFVESIAFLENRLGPADRFGVNAAVHWADDQQNPDNADRDELLVQRLPDLRVSSVPQPLPALPGGLVADFDARYSHFWAPRDAEDVYTDFRAVDDLFLDSGIDGIPDGFERDRAGNRYLLDGTVVRPDGTRVPGVFRDVVRDDAPLGPEGDGLFQEGELLLDRGHRFVLNPRVARPFRVADLIEVYPEVGWHGTYYQTELGGGELRSLATGLVDVRTRLRGELEVPGLGRMAHLVEPNVAWIGVSRQDQDDHPLFIPRPGVLQERQRQLAPWNIVRDPSDRLEGVNAVKVGVGNRFYLQESDPFSGAADDPAGPASLFADASLSFLHDFASDELSNLVLDGSIWPYPGLRIRSAGVWDADRKRISEVWLDALYTSPRGDDFLLRYRRLRDVPRFFENFRFAPDRYDELEGSLVEVSQLDFFTRIAITRRIGVTYRLRYSFEQQLLLSNEAGLEYLSRCYCWAVRLEVEDDRARGIEVGLRYRVFGLGQDTVRPFRPGGGSDRRRSGDPMIDDPFADDDEIL